MFRLAFIAIESGACVANPVYQTEKECFEQLKSIEELGHNNEMVQLNTDAFGRKYVIPLDMKRFVVVIEPIEEEEEFQ